MNESHGLVPDLDPIFAYIDAHAEEYVARLIEYVRMPSISAHGLGMGEVADMLIGRLAAIGMDARLVASAGWPMV